MSCAACGQRQCAHPDLVFAGLVPTDGGRGRIATRAVGMPGAGGKAALLAAGNGHDSAPSVSTGANSSRHVSQAVSRTMLHHRAPVLESGSDHVDAGTFAGPGPGDYFAGFAVWPGRSDGVTAVSDAVAGAK